MLKLILIGFAVAWAALPAETPRHIEELFLAPCCWRENLAFHQSPQAEAMRTEIRQLLASGKTRADIVAFYVARYGERVLREPRGAAWIWLTVIPIVVILSGALFLSLYLRQARKRRIAEPLLAVSLPPLPDEVE